MMADTIQSCDPASGEVVGQVEVTTVAEVARTIERAREASHDWAARSPEERAKILAPAGAVLVERAEELGELLCREMGKPLREAIGEVRGCGGGLEGTAIEIAQALAPELREDDRTTSTLYHDPLGVCAAITPWNFPLAMPHWMVLPALVAGNTVVLKPSEETPIIAQQYGDVLNACLPPAVLQVIHGADAQGKDLVRGDVDLIAFTGSRETGKHILGAASEGLTRVLLELGGKDPLIVLGDADLEAAAQFAVSNSFRNAGQVCVSTERIFVDESVAAEFEQRMATLTAELRVGSGLDDVDIGPMINGRQRDHVLQQIEQARSEGARVVCGGKGHRDNFVMPTILAGLADSSSAMRDETFGPLACVVTFSDTEEAIQRANNTPFGLGASVFGGQERATRVARRLTAGMIGVNRGCGGAAATPWVGAKESGYGFHGGPEGHRQFTQTRVVSSGRTPAR